MDGEAGAIHNQPRMRRARFVHVGFGMLGGVALAVTALRAGPLDAREKAPDAKTPDAIEVACPPQLATAQRQAEDGDLKAAAASIITAEPRISNASVGLRADQDYALRIAARIVARGKKPPFEGFPSDEEQIKWAYLQVRKEKEATPTPSLLTDFGEIAARIPTERLDAMKTLEDLEERQAMTSAFGYAALARMRDEAGHESAALAAAPLRALAAGKRQISLTRCRKMTKVERVCDGGLIPN